MSGTTGALRGATLALALAAWGTAPAHAQDAEAGEASETQPAEAAAEDGSAPGEDAEAEVAEAEAAEPAAEPAEEEDPFARRPAPPIMVVVLPGRRVPPEAVTAAREALVAQVTPMARGREVHGLGAEALIATIAECDEDACLGAQLAEAGAQAGVVLRLERARRRQLDATLELRDPVSGAPRLDPIEGTVPREAEAIGDALAALTAQLEDAMPDPPPPPATLTVTVNVDGAQVQVEGHEIGTSPVAPIDVPEGNYEVVVMRPGYLSVRRQTRVSAGEQARVDVTLREIGAEVEGGGTGSGADEESPWGSPGGGEDGGGDITGEWWFWTIIGVGAALVIGGAIGIGVAVSDQGPEMPPPPQGIPLPAITGGS